MYLKILKNLDHIILITKKIRTNSLVLIFSFFTTDTLIGLFSLFVKVNYFSSGLFRTIEAFLMNKENQIKFKYLFSKIFFRTWCSFNDC